MVKLFEKVKRSSTHFFRHPLVTVKGLVFTPRRLRTFFTREHFSELPGCQHPVIDERVVLEAVRGTSVLDLGCGRGRWGVLLSQKGFRLCGVDITSDYLAEASVCGYNHLLKRDFETCSLREDFWAGCFDTVLIVEVLEHLSKKAGGQLLKDSIVIARERVVVTTPVGFYPFRGDCYVETHRCGWTQRELEQLGFKVEVHKGRLYDYFLAVHDRS